jgi:hypothetical protein
MSNISKVSCLEAIFVVNELKCLKNEMLRVNCKEEGCDQDLSDDEVTFGIARMLNASENVGPLR